jgi:endo-1,4-beta-D-glucanase Y
MKNAYRSSFRGLLSRRRFLGGALATALHPVAAKPEALRQADWILFRSKFVAADGRVIDADNAGVSHSEGQGWGMLFAVAFDDRNSFERIFAWTSRNLRRPHDALHAWRYVPGRAPPVDDPNNAADGDIFIAAALLRAAEHWNVPQHRQAASAIAVDILKLLTRRVGARTYLLPGVKGFEREDEVVLNPSYYAFPLIFELAKLVPTPRWTEIVDDGMSLIDKGRFGRWMLPPDWLRIRRSPSIIDPAPGWPPRFSFDAIRIPLWYTWGKRPVGDLQRALERYWTSFPGEFPAWVNLVTDETATYEATGGMVAVARLTQAAMHGTMPDLPSLTATSGYYDAALTILSHMAWQEITLL